MICKSFLEMTPIEQSTYIGKVVHCITNSEMLFISGQELIKKGEMIGLFEGVTINPPNASPEV
jgi:hypothetical protein